MTGEATGSRTPWPSAVWRRLRDAGGPSRSRGPADPTKAPEPTAYHPALAWLVPLSVLFLGTAGAQAVLKPLGYDELFTLYLARLGPAELWAALRAGADLLPPLGYVVPGAAVRVFGEHALALRVPAILGFWLMGVCLFTFVARRTSPLFGALAMLLPLAAPASRYAYQARPYGLVVGCAALALVAWRAVAEGRSRRLALLGLAVALGGAVSSHYYGALVVLPLALGEGVRSVQRRRVDPLVWAALAAGVVPLAAWWPLLRGAQAYAPHFWALPRWSRAWGTYVVQLRPLLLTLVAATVILARLRPGHPRAGIGGRPPGWPAHERAAVLGFLLLPVIAVSLAMVTGAGFVTRYALPTLIGVSVVFAASAHTLTASRPWVARLGALALVGTIIGNGLTAGQHSHHRRRMARRSYAVLQAAASPPGPIVVTDPMAFLPLAHGAPAGLALRLTYLVDSQAAHRAVGTDTLDAALGKLAPVAPIRVESYGDFLRAHGEFHVWESPGHFAWVRRALVGDGVQLDVRVQDEAGTLLRAFRRE